MSTETAAASLAATFVGHSTVLIEAGESRAIGRVRRERAVM